MSQVITLANRPTGKPSLSDFEFISEEKPKPDDGELLLKSEYVSVDPYMRGRMDDSDSYVKPYRLHEPMNGAVIAKAVDSRHEGFNKGDHVSGTLQWKEYQLSDGEDLMKVDQEKAPLSAYLGVLGMTGITAYVGLTEIGKPENGDTLVVSGAAGAVGSVVGQIGKIKGCRVVGIAGSDEKIELLKSKFGFDAGINYKTTDDMTQAVAEACPEGVDIYFDNVGGTVSDGVRANINDFARLVICGAIALYNATSLPTGPRFQPTLLQKRAKMQGFIIGDHQDKFSEAVENLSNWLGEGKLTYSETIVEGFDNVPQAFLDLFEGKNKGKMVVKV